MNSIHRWCTIGEEETDIERKRDEEIFSGNDLKKLMPRLVPGLVLSPQRATKRTILLDRSRYRYQTRLCSHAQISNGETNTRDNGERNFSLLYRVNCLWKKIAHADFELWITRVLSSGIRWNNIWFRAIRYLASFRTWNLHSQRGIELSGNRELLGSFSFKMFEQRLRVTTASVF